MKLEKRNFPIIGWKLDFLLLAMFGFVAIGIWMMLARITDMTELSRFQNLTVVHALGFAVILFAAPAFYIGLSKRLRGHRELVLKSDGFYYQSLEVPWSEVTGIKIHSQSFLSQVRVDVINPERFAKAGDAMRHKVNRMNIASHGTPFFISTMLMDINTQELADAMRLYWDQARNEDS